MHYKLPIISTPSIWFSVYTTIINILYIFNDSVNSQGSRDIFIATEAAGHSGVKAHDGTFTRVAKTTVLRLVTFSCTMVFSQA